MLLLRSLCAVFLMAGSVHAQTIESPQQGTAEVAPRKTPAPFPKFQSKTVRPPKPGTNKRILIQIEPKPDVAPKADVGGSEQVQLPQPAKFASFWQEVSPKLDNSGPGRLEPALLAVQKQSGLAAPRLQALDDLSKAHGIPILVETVNTQVSPALVLAVMMVESAGRADALSSAGAQGLMQLMPDTAARFGVKDAFDPAQNVAGGVRYLDWLMEKFEGDPILVLAAYNAGAGSIRDHKGVPPYPETRDYVPKVLAAFRVARGLCKTPPQLISDGCVFHALK